MASHSDISNSVAPQQGRRLACERCRSQKLRCEKSNIPNCCQRCRKADVQCSFGMALPPGRPRTNSTKAKWAAEAATTAETVPLIDTSKNDSDQAIQSTSPFHFDQALTFSRPPTAQGDPFNDGSIIDVPFPDHILTNGYGAWSAALAGAGSEHSDTGLMAMEHLHHPMSHAPNDFMIVDFTPVVTRPSSPPSQHQNLPPSPPPGVIGSELRGYKLIQAPTGSLAALVRKAADLCDDMYELRIKYHDDNSSDSESPGHFPVQMSGEVLQAANDFLTLLRRFFWEEPSGASTPSLISNTSSSNASAPTSASSSEQPRRFIYVADRPAALTLIASYQRLLDLYLLYYTAVYEYLRHTDSATRRSQPIWKDLDVGGASLGDFGDLHIQMVMQATARVLEDIESALGLSKACRVSRPSSAEGDGGGHGVLGTIVTSSFVEQCIAEGFTGGPEQGTGVIARLRETMTSLMVALNDPATR
ncbi:hypothetical protein G7054_g1287 [Neopestalotiopsis clavispora]|nr:hypothetical protein G7054_g1287 [Neopestalotiopsis clavispora]